MASDSMYTKLGKTDTEVSRICFGTWKLPTRCDYVAARKLMKEAQSYGINFFDTSDNYGAAEGWIGRAIKEGELSPDNLVIATKTGLPITEYDEFGADTSRARILQQVDRSREILGVDSIGLYQLHVRDPKTPAAEVVKTMNELIEKKKIQHYGLCNHSLEELKEVIGVCNEGSYIKPVSLQNLYNIAMVWKPSQLAALEARNNGMSFLAHSPLARSRLTEKYLSRPDPPNDELAIGVNKAFRKLIEIARENKRTVEQLALAWLLKQYNTIPIVGMYRSEYLKTAMGALDWKIDVPVWSKIHDVQREYEELAENIAETIKHNFIMATATGQ